MRIVCITCFATFFLLAAAGCDHNVALTLQGPGTVSSADGAWSCAESCTQSVGGEVVLTANPAAGASFVKWDGACSGKKPVCNLNLDDDGNVSAVFATDRTLTVEIKGDGRVSTGDGKIDCPDQCSAKVKDVGTMVLRAAPGKSAVFARFGGDCAGRTCELVMDKDKTVSAVFTAPPGTLLPVLEGGPVDGAQRAAFALSKSGDIVQASIEGKTLHLVGTKADGTPHFNEAHDASALAHPAVDFFGDDIIVLLSGETSTTVLRITPDGKTERYRTLLEGCPGLESITVVSDSAFVAGPFSGTSVCGDARLLAAGTNDIVVARIALEDGTLTWAAQLGSPGADAFVRVVTSNVEDTFVAYNGKKGARVTRLNPAGKTFPDTVLGGKSTRDVQTLAMELTPTKLVMAANIERAVDFGGGPLGVETVGQEPRLVQADFSHDLRHLDSRLVSRSPCGAAAICRFDRRGGFFRAPHEPRNAWASLTSKKSGSKKRKAKKRDAKSAALPISLPLSRVGTDGTERWNQRVKGMGAIAVIDARWSGDTLLVFAAMRGDLRVAETEIVSKAARVGVLRFLDD